MDILIIASLIIGAVILFFQVAHLNGSLLHLSGQLPYTLLQVEDGGGHLVLFLLVGSGVNISLVQLFLMRIRNVPPYIIVLGSKRLNINC